MFLPITNSCNRIIWSTHVSQYELDDNRWTEWIYESELWNNQLMGKEKQIEIFSCMISTWTTFASVWEEREKKENIVSFIPVFFSLFSKNLLFEKFSWCNLFFSLNLIVERQLNSRKIIFYWFAMMSFGNTRLWMIWMCIGQVWGELGFLWMSVLRSEKKKNLSSKLEILMN